MTTHTTARGNALLKRLDRYAGVALLAPFALQPKRDRSALADGRRIGLLKTAAIGDTLLLSGMLADIRRARPSSTIVFVTGADNHGAAKLLPDRADEHIVVSPRDPIGAIRAIRQSRLDLIVDLGAWPRFDALLAAASGARWRLGFQTANQHRHFGFDESLPHSSVVHERQNYARLFARLGIDVGAPARIVPPKVLDEYPPAPYAVLHAWSSGYMHHVKEWPAHRWAALSAALVARGLSVVLTGGPADARRTTELSKVIRSAGIDVVDAGGKYTLPQLADVLAKSSVVVSVNTGVMHLAGLIGARTVSLEGPTPPTRWGPLGPRTQSVVSTYSGAGYLNLGFEYAGERRDCMHGISVDAVVHAVDELMAQTD